MSPDHRSADSPAAWMESAYSDFAVAQIPLPPGARYEQLCFHAQQAAEKSLKAIMIALGVEFPFTHNIQFLMKTLSQRVAIPEHLRDATALTSYATTFRYPGETEPVSKNDYLCAVELAATVVRWAEETIAALPSDEKR